MKKLALIITAFILGIQVYGQDLPKIPPPPPRPKPKVKVNTKQVTLRHPDKKPITLTVPRVKISPPPPRPGHAPKAPPKPPPPPPKPL